MTTTPYRPRVIRTTPRTAVITVRQAECLDAITDGRSNADHLTLLYRNLGARDRAHAVGLVLTGRVTVLVRDPGGNRRAA